MDREALAAMLKEARAGISPESRGIPKRLERRGGKAPGLSHSNMDYLLKRGEYGKFERGQRASLDYMRDVAIILDFTEQEWVRFFGLARGEHPPCDLRPNSTVLLPQVLKDMVEATTRVAYLCDHAGNVIAYNRHAAALYSADGRMPCNTLYHLLFNPEARAKTLPHWRTVWAPTLVAMLRSLSSRHKHDATLQALERLCLADPITRDLYEEHRSIPAGLSHPDGDIKPWCHPEFGPGWIRISVSTPLDLPASMFFLVDFHPGQEPPARREPQRITTTDFTDSFPPLPHQAVHRQQHASTHPGVPVTLQTVTAETVIQPCDHPVTPPGWPQSTCSNCVPAGEGLAKVTYLRLQDQSPEAQAVGVRYDLDKLRERAERLAQDPQDATAQDEAAVLAGEIDILDEKLRGLLAELPAFEGYPQTETCRWCHGSITVDMPGQRWYAGESAAPSLLCSQPPGNRRVTHKPGERWSPEDAALIDQLKQRWGGWA
ncbi:hypothetical protein ACH427_03265 [Streptomyces sp. NPDC020379]|uniref:MmyB family transcriptional regulator n=1 Tax=Streptomyces sp. NPDC020379 TaxID=3365071 RepID=UPI0037B5D0B4